MTLPTADQLRRGRSRDTARGRTRFQPEHAISTPQVSFRRAPLRLAGAVLGAVVLTCAAIAPRSIRGELLSVTPVHYVVPAARGAGKDEADFLRAAADALASERGLRPGGVGAHCFSSGAAVLGEAAAKDTLRGVVLGGRLGAQGHLDRARSRSRGLRASRGRRVLAEARSVLRSCAPRAGSHSLKGGAGYLF